MTNFIEQAKALEPQIIAWRRDIHQNPELGFEETRTAKLVAEELRRLGMEVEVGVGKTGVVGRLGEGSPVIGIRADMDALPIQEENDVPYASTVPGKMHACGHDAHTAILLSVARMLAAMPHRPNGEVRFLFQPSEENQDPEGKSGAMRMIEDGALTGVDSMIALHVNSQLESGKIEIGGGAVAAAVDSFFATIRGKGGHGASPHKTVDPIFILAQVINAIHGIRARRINPIRSAVISIGAVHSGLATNVIPDTVELNGTIRSFDAETRHQLAQDLENAFGVARALGGDFDLRIVPGYISMKNDPAVADLIAQAGADLFGASEVVHMEPQMGAEDFSYMLELAPGAMFNLGVMLEDFNRPHHSPRFDIDEAALYRGAALLAETTCRLLAGSSHKQS